MDAFPEIILVRARLYYEQSPYPVRRSGKEEEEKEMSSFSSSSFNAVNTATATDTSTADNADAPAKDGSDGGGAADGTAGPSGSSTLSLRRKEEVTPPHQYHRCCCLFPLFELWLGLSVFPVLLVHRGIPREKRENKAREPSLELKSVPPGGRNS